MSITAEDGTGVAGAESYVTVAYADAYFAARAHLTASTTWGAADTDNKEGALREATDYVDSVYGPFYRGQRAGYVQGLQWPRTNALSDDGYALPDLPTELQKAVCELAVRALSSPLSSDAARGGRVKRNKVEGAVEQEFFEGAPTETKYGVIAGMLNSILDGSQNNNPQWLWR